MKTLTEFVAVTLKNAAKTRAELTTAGKTMEELPAAMGEALKVEGDKLTFIMNAIEAVGNKTEDLKRVVVLSLNAGEKAPANVKQMGEHYYAIEYYPSLAPKRGRERDSRDKGRGARGDKRGGKRGEKRGEKRGDSRNAGDRKPEGDRPRGPRPPRGPRAPGRADRERSEPQLPRMAGGVVIAANPEAGITTVSFEKPGRERKPRPPKQPRPQGRSGLELPKPKTAVAAAPASAPEAQAAPAPTSEETSTS